MDKALQQVVRGRAKGTCEYCRMPQGLDDLPFQIDHIIALKHSGSTTEDNLAFSCFYCNTHKGPNVAGVDPESGDIVRLFHPRRDVWEEHFYWVDALLKAHTAVGRATILVL